jgi:cytochrome c oxidase assembly protein subunit 15
VTSTLRRGAALWGALALACAVTFQAALGILTLLEQAPLAIALMHQGMAMIVLTIAVVHAQGLAANESIRSAALLPDPADKLGAAARS